MSGEMEENSEQDMSHVIRDLRNNDPPNVEGINKHPYYLRAKTPRFTGYGRGEEAGFKKPASFGKKFVMSPTPSHGSKSDHFDEVDLANCLVMLSNKSHHALSSDYYKEEIDKGKEVVEKGMFQCKACKKIFNSHQALGGHRASHKKVKGCFAAKSVDDDDQDSIQEEHDSLTLSGSDPSRTARKGAKMHECSVCRRVFSSGQALGGHKRCHWLTTSTDNAFIPSFQDFQYDAMFTNHPHHEYNNNNNNNIRDQDDHDRLDLNLNLPAPQLDRNHIAHDNTSVFEASTRLYNLQQHHNHQKIVPSTEIDNGEKGCEVNDNKLRKLSDLKDVNLDGGWLRVGIASTADIY
ncbi:hypothetical protein DH2020_028545 [Rehmannia glutinosa]|uniref:C2H2-type domain-containing protein n=1 Tax=Rehmannia glutinosa TaxID=99300 RepID=A0ABR0VV84_REHGL